MEQLNRYYRCSKITGRKFLRLRRHFTLDLTASRTAQPTGLQRKSVNTIFLKIRERIAEECERASPFSQCEVEVDESYFGTRRVRGKRGRGASGKTIVFGIFKRNGCVYTEIVPDCKKAMWQAIIRGRVAAEAVIHSDGWRGYDGLVDVGYSKHLRVNHGSNEFVRGNSHVNGIEGFWSFAKRKASEVQRSLLGDIQLALERVRIQIQQSAQKLVPRVVEVVEKEPALDHFCYSRALL